MGKTFLVSYLCGFLIIVIQSSALAQPTTNDGCADAVNQILGLKEKQSQVSALLKPSVDSIQSKEALSKLQQKLGLDDLNFAYFMGLYHAQTHQKASEALHIFEEGKNLGEGSVAYPTAIAPENMMKDLPHIQYEKLRKNEIA